MSHLAKRGDLAREFRSKDDRHAYHALAVAAISMTDKELLMMRAYTARILYSRDFSQNEHKHANIALAAYENDLDRRGIF